MMKNDVLQHVSDILDFDTEQLTRIFALGGAEPTAEQISEWLTADDDTEELVLEDVQLAAFLNGLIIERRGKKEGDQPEPEILLSNNKIFRKLMIAFDLKADDAVEMLALADWDVTKRELSSYFRKPNNTHYRACNDDVFAGFLTGLQLKLKP